MEVQVLSRKQQVRYRSPWGQQRLEEVVAVFPDAVGSAPDGSGIVLIGQRSAGIAGLNCIFEAAYAVVGHLDAFFCLPCLELPVFCRTCARGGSLPFSDLGIAHRGKYVKMGGISAVRARRNLLAYEYAFYLSHVGLLGDVPYRIKVRTVAVEVAVEVRNLSFLEFYVYGKESVGLVQVQYPPPEDRSDALAFLDK